MKNNMKSAYAGVATVAVLGLLTGILFLTIPVKWILSLLFVVLGIFTVISAIPGMVTGIHSIETGAGKFLLVTSLLELAVGLLLIFWHNTILMLAVGAYLVVLPLLEIFAASDRNAAFRRALPQLILGVVLILVGPANALEWLLRAAGVAVLVMTVLAVILMTVAIQKKQNTPGGRIFADTDGDGTIDTVYVDTTGDGKADTATSYREKDNQ